MAQQAGEYNAQVAEQNAALARQQAFEEARRTRIQGRKVIGDMAANYGHSGIGIQGSALDVLMESTANVELDALTKEHSGFTKASMFEGEAEMDRSMGSEARTSSYFSAAGQLMAAGGTAAKGGKS
jgi:hypothetical protein